MRRVLSSVVFLLVVASVWGMIPRALEPGHRTVRVLGDLGVWTACLRARHWPMRYERGFLVLDANDADGLLLTLASFYRTLSTMIDVADENIANANTRNTLTGQPYCRRRVELNARGEILTVTDDDHPGLRYMYDPRNPKAARQGSHKGYVAHSNVCLPEERCNILHDKYEQQMILNLMHEIDPHIIFGEEPWVPPLPLHGKPAAPDV